MNISVMTHTVQFPHTGLKQHNSSFGAENFPLGLWFVLKSCNSCSLRKKSTSLGQLWSACQHCSPILIVMLSAGIFYGLVPTAIFLLRVPMVKRWLGLFRGGPLLMLPPRLLVPTLLPFSVYVPLLFSLCDMGRTDLSVGKGSLSQPAFYSSLSAKIASRGSMQCRKEPICPMRLFQKIVGCVDSLLLELGDLRR